MDQLAFIDAESARIAQIALTTGGELAVPSCPGWTVVDLVRHLGEVHEFWAHTILAANPAAPWEGERAIAPAECAVAVAWMREQTGRLLDVMSSHDLAAPCWTWWGEPLTAGAVRRHQVQEVALHRWDAEGALGVTLEVDREVAADGIPEWIEVRLPWMTELPRPMVQFAASDLAGSWTLPSDEPECEQRVLISGAVSDLLLFLNGRRSLEGLSVTGDVELLDPLLSQLASLNS